MPTSESEEQLPGENSAADPPSGDGDSIKLLHKCMTKATTAKGEQRKYGPNWVTSRRTSLKIFDDKLQCGNWLIPYVEIQEATLYSFRSIFLRVPGYILTVKTSDITYHFGLNGWGAYWKDELPFVVKREKGKIGITWFSIAIRLLLIGYVAKIAWEWVTH